jgi:predicted phosphodiesterase
MRIALIADIHGNAVALDAALADIDTQAIDQIVCLGDVAMMGPQPLACIHRIQALGCPVIMGNTDEWLVSDEAAGEAPADSPPSTIIAYWGAAQLSQAEQSFLASFAPTHALALDDDHTLLCFHGSPISNRDIILATTPEIQLESLLGGSNAAVLAGGHMHVQILRRHLGATFINPGSIGMPLDRDLAPDRPRQYTPRAEYAILAWAQGQPAITFRRVPYALDDLRAAVAQSHMPHPDWWLAQWQE